MTIHDIAHHQASTSLSPQFLGFWFVYYKVGFNEMCICACVFVLGSHSHQCSGSQHSSNGSMNGLLMGGRVAGDNSSVMAGGRQNSSAAVRAYESTRSNRFSYYIFVSPWSGTRPHRLVLTKTTSVQCSFQLASSGLTHRERTVHRHKSDSS